MNHFFSASEALSGEVGKAPCDSGALQSVPALTLYFALLYTTPRYPFFPPPESHFGREGVACQFFFKILHFLKCWFALDGSEALVGETCFDVGVVDATDDGDVGVERGGSHDDGILWRWWLVGLLRRAARAVRNGHEDGAPARHPGAVGVGGHGCCLFVFRRLAVVLG